MLEAALCLPSPTLVMPRHLHCLTTHSSIKTFLACARLLGASKLRYFREVESGWVPLGCLFTANVVPVGISPDLCSLQVWSFASLPSFFITAVVIGVFFSCSGRSRSCVLFHLLVTVFLSWCTFRWSSKLVCKLMFLFRRHQIPQALPLRDQASCFLLSP